jgi:membrane protein implicated in regulation of membrane protease activity
MELFDHLHAWHWATLAVILFALEMLVSTGFLLGIGLAAIVLAVIMLVLPTLAWEWQLLLFGVLCVTLTLAYRKYFRNVNEATDNPLLNDRAAQLVGKSFILGVDLDRSGADMLGDTRWTLRSSGRLAKGTRVRVTGVDGMVLHIEEDL